MALDKTTKMANRFGLDMKFYKYTGSAPEGETNLVATIDFVNSTTLDLSSEIIWATGGRGHANMIGFPGNIEGTFTIESQVNTMQLLALASGNDPSTISTKAQFKNATLGDVKQQVYTIVGETLYVTEDGKTYTEKVTIYKAIVRPGYNVTYTGDGDPQSITIEFELGANAAGNVADIERSENA